MERTRALAVLALAVLLLTNACSGGERAPSETAALANDDLEERLLGSWAGQNETRGSMSFTFDKDGNTTWVVNLPSGPETMNISYSTATQDGSLHVDLSGFEDGPLRGLTMYGLISFDGSDTLRIDFEPGPPGDPGRRPGALTSPDVLTLVRTG